MRRGLGSDVACRVAFSKVSRRAMASSQMPDCRGGVFATRRFPRQSPPHTEHTMPAHRVPVYPPSRLRCPWRGILAPRFPARPLLISSIPCPSPRSCVPTIPSAPPLACILSPIFPNFARGFWLGRVRRSFAPYDSDRASPSSAPTAPVVGPAAAADGWACVWAYAGGGAGFPGVATTRCPCALPPSRHAGVCSCQRPA